VTDEERQDHGDSTPQLIAQRVAALLARLGLIRPPEEERAADDH
jgi:hypothetical protein